jgi:hypothetical protein
MIFMISRTLSNISSLSLIEKDILKKRKGRGNKMRKEEEGRMNKDKEGNNKKKKDKKRGKKD